VSPNTRNCDAILSLLEMYVLGEGTEAERRNISRHLAGCKACQAELESIQQLVLVARSDAVPSLSPAYQQRRESFLQKGTDTESPAPERVESLATRGILGVLSTLAYLRLRFRTSARFRFLVIFAGAQAILILILTSGLIPGKPRKPSVPATWKNFVYEEKDRIQEDDLNDDLPGVAGELPRKKLRVKPEENPGRHGQGPALVRDDLSRRSQELFRTRVYEGRAAGNRLALLRRWGGNEATERAVKHGLDWLGRQQLADGCFPLGKKKTAGHAAVGTTSLAVLAFLGHGLSEESHRVSGEKGINFLLAQQHDHGFIGPDANTRTFDNLPILNHALAAQALIDAVEMGVGKVSEKSVQKALDWLTPDTLKDPGVVTQAGFVLFLARGLGYKVDQKSLDHCLGWFNRPDNQTLFQKGRASKLVFNAGRALLQNIAGLKRTQGGNHPWEVLFESIPDGDQNAHLLGWLFASQALVQVGDSASWNRWNRTLIKNITNRQAGNGRFAWRSQEDATDGVSATALSVLLLQVYYRYGTF